MHEALGFISSTFHRKVSVSGYMFKSILVALENRHNFHSTLVYLLEQLLLHQFLELV